MFSVDFSLPLMEPQEHACRAALITPFSFYRQLLLATPPSPCSFCLRRDLTPHTLWLWGLSCPVKKAFFIIPAYFCLLGQYHPFDMKNSKFTTKAQFEGRIDKAKNKWEKVIVECRGELLQKDARACPSFLPLENILFLSGRGPPFLLTWL